MYVATHGKDHSALSTQHVSRSLSGKYGTCIYSERVILQFMCVGSVDRMRSQS